MTPSDSSGSDPVVVPEETRAAFPDLIPMILESQSMNDEERQYWVDVLPALLPDQIEKLKGILTNERDQLAAIDAKYAEEIDRIGEGKTIEDMGEERKARHTERQSKESKTRSEEEKKADDLLKKIEGA